ncbi:DUF4332 domain-containing protein [Rhodopirellula sp. MGV]|uniref:DUF4332 domain-containing protein n=1 Tax=Rhodopirellula sp. MGV TaxID=2023130 RepID=UPI0013044980|nr:DUF4332 domain-containing protein [Rhodopirellula sp. MGV]
MLLDRIDIDTHGPLNRVELGPFSEGLNVVCTPEGSGKTALVRFIRDSLVRREYPLGMMSSSAGRVVWADQNGKIHCRREHDGTAAGRRTIEFETRGETAHRFDWLHGSWINGIADSNDASRALESIRIPDAIVDGIVTDTAVTSVSRVIAACLTAGLNDPSLFSQLPQNASAVSGLSPAEQKDAEAQRRAIRDELARIEAELATIPNSDTPVTNSESRRQALRARLNDLYSRSHRVRAGYGVPYAANEATSEELSSLQHRIWTLRVRHGELVRWLDHLKSDQNRIRYSAPITSSPYASSSMAGPSTQPGYSKLEIDARLRERLTEVDGQIIRWRRVLAELNSLRDMVWADRHRHALHQFATRTDAQPLSDWWLQRERMNYVASSLDYFAGHPRVAPSQLHSWAEIEATRSFAWPDEIDLRVEALIRKIDSLHHYYGQSGRSTWAWYGDATGQTYPDLPNNWARYHDGGLVGHLRALREDLSAARRHGFGFANALPVSTLPVSAPNAISVRREREMMDLQASENWIIASIERLLVHRSQLVRDHRQMELVRYPSWLDDRYYVQSWSPWYVDHLQQEIAARTAELQSSAAELDRCVSRASELRVALRDFAGPAAYDTTTLGAIDAEINSIHAELGAIDQASFATPSSPRLEWLQRRRSELQEKLGAPQSAYRSAVPLADEASAWLVRLSGGRLRRVDWNPAEFTTGNKPAGRAHIDGQDETSCSGVDRALATLAIRLAAGDLLARTGRAIPLVVEAHRELLHAAAQTTTEPSASALNANTLENAYGQFPEVNLAVIAALNDYAKSGRQLVVLTSDPAFADQVQRRGGRVFQIQGERVAHEHRPVWRPHYASETYVGPHAGAFVPGEAVDPLLNGDAMIDHYYDEYFQGLPVGQSFADVNRNLDAVWQEAYGIAGYPASSQHGYAATEMPYRTANGHGNPYNGAVNGTAFRSHLQTSSNPQGHGVAPNDSFAPNYGAAPEYGVASNASAARAYQSKGSIPTQAPSAPHQTWNDGYYYCDSYTTAPLSRSQPTQSQGEPSNKARNGERPSSSPFFLTIDSPIDQAPSVDAVAAARLRALNVTHITHLMNQDPNRLADALGLASVTAATIRRWQAECRLVCNVPQLRGFDARVLVGCGISDPGLLAATDPNDLLDRVEAFLATERGQRILLSGTSYELSRITSWIAAAGVQPMIDAANGQRERRTVNGRVVRQSRSLSGQERRAISGQRDQDCYEYEFTDDHGRIARASSGRSRGSAGRSRGSTARSRDNAARSSQSRTNGYANGHESNLNRQRSEQTNRINGNHERTDREPRQSRPERSRSTTSYESRSSANGVETERSGRPARSLKKRRSTSERSQRERSSDREVYGEDGELKFYLQRNSPVVDAPSIGSRMAERLETVGIIDVNDLLEADPETLADQLDHRRIDADVIRVWQNQAILVCRIPMLRGHDAQLLVAADVNTAEEVAESDADELFELISPIAKSNEGKRILRGGKLPDLEEINEWISYAKQNRELVAA